MEQILQSRRIKFKMVKINQIVKKNPMFKLIFILLILLPTHSYAYLGPGLGGGIIAAIIGVIIAILATFFGILWFPLKKFFKKKKDKKKDTKKQ